MLAVVRAMCQCAPSNIQLTASPSLPSGKQQTVQEVCVLVCEPVRTLCVHGPYCMQHGSGCDNVVLCVHRAMRASNPPAPVSNHHLLTAVSPVRPCPSSSTLLRLLQQRQVQDR